MNILNLINFLLNYIKIFYYIKFHIFLIISGFQAYVRPNWFGLRIAGLVVIMCASLTVASVICLTVPVLVGRSFMYLVLGDTQVGNNIKSSLLMCNTFLNSYFIYFF